MDRNLQTAETAPLPGWRKHVRQLPVHGGYGRAVVGPRFRRVAHPQRIDALLDGLIDRKEIHSAVLSVVSGDGAFRWTGARGVISPDGTLMLPATPWFIASITKLFIASTVMRMVEEGELALEDRLVDRLAASVTDRLHVLEGEDRTDQITVEHLLSHASGLPDYIEDYPATRLDEGADRRSLVEILMEDGDREWSLKDTARWVRERLTPHFGPQPLNARRVRIRYSDTNYQLLVGIIETRRDEPFFQITGGVQGGLFTLRRHRIVRAPAWNPSPSPARFRLVYDATRTRGLRGVRRGSVAGCGLGRGRGPEQCAVDTVSRRAVDGGPGAGGDSAGPEVGGQDPQPHRLR